MVVCVAKLLPLIGSPRAVTPIEREFLFSTELHARSCAKCCLLMELEIKYRFRLRCA